MEIIYLLIPLSILILIGIVWVLMWAVRSGQFDDMEGPAYRVLQDDDGIIKTNKPEDKPGHTETKDS